MNERCFACNRKLGKNPQQADTRDSQVVLVGSECYRLIVEAGELGYQPPKGGPRLYPITLVQAIVNKYADYLQCGPNGGKV